MKLRLTSLMAFMTAASGLCVTSAQGYYDDDIYFVPGKTSSAVVPSTVDDFEPAGSYTPTSGGLAVDVDAYNRRTSDTTVSVADTVTATPTFAYTRSIERFYNPQVVVGSADSTLAAYYYSEPATTNINIYLDTPDYYWGYPYGYNYYSYASPYCWGRPGWYCASYYNPWNWNYGWSWGWNSWDWGWGPSWTYYPPSWGWGWGWGGSYYPPAHRPSWTYRPSGNSRPAYAGTHYGYGNNSRPSYSGNSRPSYRPGSSYSPGTSSAPSYRPSGRPGRSSGSSNYRPGYNNNNNNNSTSRPSYNNNNNNNSNYSRPSYNNNSRPSYRPSTGGGSRSNGTTGSGGRSGGGAGGRGRH